MAGARVRALRAVEFGVAEPEAAATFFVDAWRLAPVGERSGIRYFRASGRHHWVTSIRKAAVPGLVRIVFDAADRAALERLREQVSAAGAREVQPIVELLTPGGGYGFGFKDPDGRNLAVVAEVEDLAPLADAADRPRKMSHVNVHSPDGERCFAFFRDGLGFRLSEQTRPMWFIRCNNDHCSIVISRHDKPTLNHVAYEVPGWEDVMRGIGRLRDHGYQIGWGPGRHGPGDAVFAYFIGHERLPLEYTAEQAVVDDATHVPMPMDHWKWPPGRLDHWGLMPGPRPEFVALKDVFAFCADGHVLDG